MVGSSPDRVIPKIIKLVCVASPLSMQHKGVRVMTGWLGHIANILLKVSLNTINQSISQYAFTCVENIFPTQCHGL
jgi:hypothetical protein